MIVGVSGGIASFSEEAARRYCAEHEIHIEEMKYLINAGGVLKALNGGHINLGFFPIENSNGGIVYESIRAMGRDAFDIKEFFEIDVRHCLMIRPDANPKKIKLIVSHDQALKQCRMYLRIKYPKAEIKPWSDTASAVKDLREGKLPKNSAAIASFKAAKYYGMKVVEKNIQDLKFNFTTFLAVT